MTDLRHLRDDDGMAYYAFEAQHICGHLRDHTREVPPAPLTHEWMLNVRQRAERKPCEECAADGWTRPKRPTTP